MGTALVTGASQGIGADIARRLLEAGHAVVNLSRKPAPFEHERLSNVACDMLDEASVEAACIEIAELEITHVVHNAGLVWPNLVADATADEMAGMMAIHVTAPMRLTQAVLPVMRERGFGRIVFVTSRAALGVPTRTAYSASKAAVHGMARTWALELAPEGITVNSVAPGPILTDNFWSIIPQGSEREKKLAAALPVRRLGTVEDVTHAVLFFLDDRAGFTTGQTLYVCGGASVGTVSL